MLASWLYPHFCIKCLQHPTDTSRKTVETLPGWPRLDLWLLTVETPRGHETLCEVLTAEDINQERVSSNSQSPTGSPTCLDSLVKQSSDVLQGVHDLPSPVKKVKSLTNAERCKLYRETIKSDPQSHDAKRLKDIERFKRNYRRPRTEEELQIRRENDMLRARRCRDRKKATRAAEMLLDSTVPFKQVKMQCVITEQCERQEKTQRQLWNSQKWRSHREKCAAYQHHRKAQMPESLTRIKSEDQSAEIHSQEGLTSIKSEDNLKLIHSQEGFLPLDMKCHQKDQGPTGSWEPDIQVKSENVQSDDEYNSKSGGTKKWVVCEGGLLKEVLEVDHTNWSVETSKDSSEDVVKPYVNDACTEQFMQSSHPDGHEQVSAARGYLRTTGPAVCGCRVKPMHGPSSTAKQLGVLCSDLKETGETTWTMVDCLLDIETILFPPFCKHYTIAI
ncbi:hypothetical protein LSAT2_028660 [Lamellibrachia satsuma]|nr:hypothetical protein LSAT2_028660 [Lamellibrachia satsuma]